MSLQTTGLDPVRMFKTWQSAGNGPDFPPIPNPESASNSPIPAEPVWRPRSRTHVTRILGKLCFSCRSVNPLDDKFCGECGAPLFRPPDKQMLRTGRG